VRGKLWEVWEVWEEESYLAPHASGQKDPTSASASGSSSLLFPSRFQARDGIQLEVPPFKGVLKIDPSVSVHVDIDVQCFVQRFVHCNLRRTTYIAQLKCIRCTMYTMYHLASSPAIYPYIAKHMRICHSLASVPNAKCLVPFAIPPHFSHAMLQYAMLSHPTTDCPKKPRSLNIGMRLVCRSSPTESYPVNTTLTSIPFPNTIPS
jgi:hypothetical protein